MKVTVLVKALQTLDALRVCAWILETSVMGKYCIPHTVSGYQGKGRYK